MKVIKIKKTINLVTLITGISTIICVLVFLTTDISLFETIAITFGTTFYHFAMRLLVGNLFLLLPTNNEFYKHRWFQITNFEKKMYKFIGVKHWKNKMPTYLPELFDITKSSKENVIFEMCRAELVHEICMICSFIPILFTLLFGSFWVFFITSLLASIFDLLFVFIQRYNRPRVISIIRRKSLNNKSEH